MSTLEAIQMFRPPFSRSRMTLTTSVLCLLAWSPAAALQELQSGTSSVGAGLFVVESTYKHDNKGKDLKAARVQPGFLVDDELGVTALSGLIGADKSKLYTAGSRSGVTFEVLAVDASNDLAVIRPKWPSEAKSTDSADAVAATEASSPRVPLTTASDASKPFDPSHRVAWIDPVDRSRVRSLALADLLDTEARGGPKVRAQPTAGALGGCPVVDSKGQLVGIWQWTWAALDPVTPQLVSAKDVFSLAQRARDEPNPDALKTMAAAYLPSRSMPQLTWSSKEVSTPPTASKNAEKLRNDLRCSKCDGAGTKPHVLKDSNERTRVDTVVPCPTCNRSCVIKEKDLWVELRTLASSLMSVPPDKGLDGVTLSLELGLQEALKLNETAILLSAYDGGKEELAIQKLVPGRATVFTVVREFWPTDDSVLWGERVRVVRDPSYPSLILRAPYTRSTVREGQGAWVIGVVAGTVTHERETFVVLDRAIAVPVPARWLRPGR